MEYIEESRSIPIYADCDILVVGGGCTGQAAGVAAAVAIADKTNAKEVDIRKVQDILAGEQDVPLPRNSHTDISYTQLCEEKQYGLYTDAAKKAAELGDATSHRQDNQIAAEAAKRKNNAVEH